MSPCLFDVSHSECEIARSWAMCDEMPCLKRRDRCLAIIFQNESMFVTAECHEHQNYLKHQRKLRSSKQKCLATSYICIFPMKVANKGSCPEVFLYDCVRYIKKKVGVPFYPMASHSKQLFHTIFSKSGDSSC